jgi:hypothetical protein
LPFKYAIAVTTDKIKPRNQWSDYWGDPEYETEKLSAPKDYAETHEDGYRMLVSVTGEPLTGWLRIKRRAIDHTELKKKSKAPAVTDFMGTELAVDDYVVTYVKRHVDLQVCQVIGFVKQGKARILPLGNFEQEHGILKFPTEIVKIPEHVLGEDPTAEWVPTEEEIL